MYGNKIDYGKIIKKLRTKHNLTQSELGKIISVGKTAISNYETGYSVPSAQVMENMAQNFGMTLVEFLSSDSSNTQLNFSLPRLSQPINDKVVPYIKEANINERTLKAQKYMDSYLTLPGFMFDTDNEYICIKMPDDSMQDEHIQKNDYIIVRKSNLIENRKIVLAIYRPTGEYMVRRYIRDEHIVALVPSSGSTKYNILRSDERDEDIYIVGYIEKVINSVK